MRYVSNWGHGDGASEAMDRVDEEIDTAYLYGHGATPEPSRGAARDSFTSSYKRVIPEKPKVTGKRICLACSDAFEAGDISDKGYCPADQTIYLQILARTKVAAEMGRAK